MYCLTVVASLVLKPCSQQHELFHVFVQKVSEVRRSSVIGGTPFTRVNRFIENYYRNNKYISNF